MGTTGGFWVLGAAAAGSQEGFATDFGLTVLTRKVL